MVFRSLETWVFFSLVLLITVIFFWMTLPFLLPIFWAIVLAILFQPLYVRLVGLLRGRNAVAAFLATFSVIFVVLVPLALVVATVTRQALALYQQISAGKIDLSKPIAFFEKTLPQLTTLLREYNVDIDQVRQSINSAAMVVTQWIAGEAVSIGQNVVVVAILFALMLYFLFFFFRDGDRIIRVVIRALPMGDEREERLFKKFAQVSRAIIKGTLVVAAVQGTIGGVLFLLVGIKAAAFWGVIMALLSLVPALGAALVWVPAAIFLLASGKIWQAIVLIVGGALVIGLADNVLRPILVGRDTKMPDYLVLLATLGGLNVFGLAGFVVGPIVAALFLVMWEMFAEEYAPS